MKPVWILEEFRTAENLREDIEHLKKLQSEFSLDAKTYNQTLEAIQARIEAHPEGVWQGVEGKCKYNAFCHEAKLYIRMRPKSSYRVLKAELNDAATSWVGYVNGVENDGVMRYLMATYK